MAHDAQQSPNDHVAVGQQDDSSGRSVLAGLRTLFQLVGPSPAGECLEARLGTGLEEPAAVLHEQPWVVLDRTFAFVDVSGFTTLCEQRGPHEALELLTGFRAVTREITARRGVRVAKWLGDGVMLLGAEPGPVVATVAELLLRMAARGVDLHAGVAVGEALLFEGDDYVGRAVNIAARLGAFAGPGQALAWGLTPEQAPVWVQADPMAPISLAGLGELADVLQIAASNEVGELLKHEAA